MVTTVFVKPSGSGVFSKKYMAMDWLRTRPELLALVHRTRKGEDILFPNLKLFTSQLQSMSLTDANKWLQDKVDVTHNDISFLGISIQEDVAVWAGPLLVALLMVYLLAHFRRLHRIRDMDGSPVKVFPWIGLFDDGLGRTLTYVSIGLLPPASEGALLVRAGHWPAHTTLAAVLLTVATAVVAALLLVEIHFIRRELNRPVSAP